MELIETREQYGRLKCAQYDIGRQPKTLVVALHGYGAPGDDLVPLLESWVHFLGTQVDGVRFVFPAALHSLSELGIPGGRAWWPINMQRLMDLVEAGDFLELCVHEPPGIDEARAALTESLDLMLKALDTDANHLILGGFSQGAMLSMDTALRGLETPPAGLFLFSGMLICQQAWQSNLSRLVHTKVVQSHGSLDPILPFAAAEQLHALLKVAGVPTEFVPFQGGHTLTLEALEASARVISDVIEKGKKIG